MKILLVLFLVCILNLASLAQDPRAARFDSLFNEAFQKDEFNGNVLVAENGKVIYQRSFGLADWKTGAKLNNESIFELASVSKQFTAMGIMILANEGKLSLDDSLRKFFPELPYTGVKVRHLLHHTGGLPDYMDFFGSQWDSGKIANNKDIIRLFAEHKPAIVFAPGEKWEYSNTGYAILASISEKVSGKSFPVFLKERIFEPLGMKRTLVFGRRIEKTVPDNYAFGYVYAPVSKTYVLPDVDPRFRTLVYTLDGIQGDGTVNSTTGDLFKWHQALNTEKLVPRKMIEEAFTSGTVVSGGTGYGFGWGLSNSKTYGKFASHSGGWPGYSTYIERSLEDDRMFVILQNNGKKLFPAVKVRAVLYNILPETLTEKPVTPEEMQVYLGEYELSPGFILTITMKDGKLFAQATGQQAFEIFRQEGDLFFLKVVEAKLQFNRNEENRIGGLTLLQNGNEIPAKKIK